MAGAAAAAAAAIKAKLAAAGKLSVDHPSMAPPPVAAVPGGPPPPAVVPEEGQTSIEVPINDIAVSPRTVLTRGPKQEEMSAQFGVAITTRGRYFPPGSTVPTGEKALSLLVEGKKADCDRAVEYINGVIGETPTPGGGGGATVNAGVGSGMGTYSTPGPPVHADAPYRRPKSEKVYLDMHVIPGFDLTGKIAGPNGQYLGHIAQETGCTVELRGRGTGTVDPQTRLESTESMHIFLENSDPTAIGTASELCKSLISTVREEWKAFKNQPPPKSTPAYSPRPPAAYRMPPPQPYGGYPGSAQYYRPPAHGYPPMMYPQYPSAPQAVGYPQAMPGQGWNYYPGGYPANGTAGAYSAVSPASAYDSAPAVAPPVPASSTTEAPPLPPGAPPPPEPTLQESAPPPPPPDEATQPPLPSDPPNTQNVVADAPKRKFTEATAPPIPHPTVSTNSVTSSDDHAAKRARSGPLVDYS